MRTVTNLLSLEKRAAIVTGGAGHIGQACVDALAELGANVCVVDKDRDAAERVAERVERGLGTRALPIHVDLGSPAELERALTLCLDAFGRLDILVNNAAFTGVSGLPGYAVPFEEQSLDAWNAALQVNLTAPFLLSQRAFPALARSGHGAIINVGSIYGVAGPRMSLYEGTKLGNPAAYGATKGGLVQLTRYLAVVMAPAVRVNCLSPGGVERGQPTIFQERYVANAPLARMATEEDFKGAFAYLASDASAYVTGQNLMVDGGWTVW